MSISWHDGALRCLADCSFGYVQVPSSTCSLRACDYMQSHQHVMRRDVTVQVSNVEVYYRAVSFYLEQHPDLLVDLLKVCIFKLPTPSCCPSSCLQHASHPRDQQKYSTGHACFC